MPSDLRERLASPSQPICWPGGRQTPEWGGQPLDRRGFVRASRLTRVPPRADPGRPRPRTHSPMQIVSTRCSSRTTPRSPGARLRSTSDGQRFQSVDDAGHEARRRPSASRSRASRSHRAARTARVSPLADPLDHALVGGRRRRAEQSRYNHDISLVRLGRSPRSRDSAVGSGTESAASYFGGTL